MKDSRLQKAIHSIRNIRMTDAEKKTMIERIVGEPIAAQKPLSVRSPWTVYSLGVWVTHQRWSVAVLILVVIAGGGGIVSAAEGALPGSVLYPVKVSVTEPIRDALAVTPAGQAEWQATKAERRLEEATTLAVEGKLTESVEQEIQERLEKHTQEFASALEHVREDGGEDRADEISVAFQASLGARARVFEVVSLTDKNDEVPSEHVTVATIARDNARSVGEVRGGNGPVSFAKMAAPMMQVVSEGVSSATLSVETNVAPAGDVSDSARMATEISADPMQSGKKQDKVYSYKRSKAAAEKTIEAVSRDIQKVASSTNPLKIKVIDTAKLRLEESRQILLEAGELFDAGDDEGAYVRILESERAAKEADILFNESIKVEKNEKVRDVKKVILQDDEQRTANVRDGFKNEGKRDGNVSDDSDEKRKDVKDKKRGDSQKSD